MTSLFDDLKQGLEEAIEIEKGNLKGRKRTLEIAPVRKYSGREIRSIRMKLLMTQKSFACFMGVSPKTVEAWEREASFPSGSSCRLLEMLDNNGLDSFAFVSIRP